MYRLWTVLRKYRGVYKSAFAITEKRVKNWEKIAQTLSGRTNWSGMRLNRESGAICGPISYLNWANHSRSVGIHAKKDKEKSSSS